MFPLRASVLVSMMTVYWHRDDIGCVRWYTDEQSFRTGGRVRYAGMEKRRNESEGGDSYRWLEIFYQHEVALLILQLAVFSSHIHYALN